MMFPDDGPAYRVVERVHWRCPPDKRAEARAIIEGSLRAAPEETLGAALYRLRMLTRGRDQRSAADQEIEAAIWVEQLRAWPADIALEVIRTWPERKNGEWWPTWAEVERELRKRATVRIALAAAVDRDPEPDSATSAEESAEHRAAVVDRLWRNGARPVVNNVPSAEIERALAEKRIGELYRVVRGGGLPPLSDAAKSCLGLSTENACGNDG